MNLLRVIIDHPSVIQTISTDCFIRYIVISLDVLCVDSPDCGNIFMCFMN